jgi:hypothetical protein
LSRKKKTICFLEVEQNARVIAGVTVKARIARSEVLNQIAFKIGGYPWFEGIVLVGVSLWSLVFWCLGGF